MMQRKLAERELTNEGVGSRASGTAEDAARPSIWPNRPYRGFMLAGMSMTGCLMPVNASAQITNAPDFRQT